MPVQRTLARAHRALPLRDLATLLKSPFHEDRLTALFILVHRHPRAEPAERERIHALYRRAVEEGEVNNWDLVDSSAEVLMGAHLEAPGGGATSAGARLLDEWAKDRSLWKRRVAMIATLRYVRRGHLVDALRLCERLLGDPHDLMHKAVGWVLREIGDRQEALLRDFLRAHGPELPRTSLRYAIEHLPEADRRVFMAVKTRPPASLRG